MLFLVSIFFIGCSAPTITSNFDHSVNFTTYKTFSFAHYEVKPKTKLGEYEDPEITKIIRQAITNELIEAGYTQTEGTPDLLVVYDIIITEKVDPRVDSAVIYKPWVDTKTDSFNYTEGLLVVRLIDHAIGKMVWQGSLAGILNRKPEQLGKRAETYIAKLFDSLTEQMQ